MRPLRLLAALLGVAASGSPAIAKLLPSFHPESSAWAATDVLVATEGAVLDGVFEVLETWKGGLKKGDAVTVPELAAFAPEERREVAPDLLDRGGGLGSSSPAPVWSCSS